jgi:hypothetical protein
MSNASPEIPPEPPQLDFERAEFSEPTTPHVQCAMCGGQIATEYWQYLGKVLCDVCRDAVHRSSEEARRSATFAKAFLYGGGVALGCGIGYAIFVRLTQIQFALVTIGMGWAIGRSIQHVTRGFGTQKHQVLAVALTYFASTMGYLPALFKGIGDQMEQRAESAASAEPAAAPSSLPTATSPAVAPDAPPPPASPSASSAEAEPGPLASLAYIAYIAGIVVFYMLAAPFYEISAGFSGVLGLLIIFFGLQTAFNVSRPVEASITGPHKISAASRS